jgi:hypothetical protein
LVANLPWQANQKVKIARGRAIFPYIVTLQSTTGYSNRSKLYTCLVMHLLFMWCQSWSWRRLSLFFKIAFRIQEQDCFTGIVITYDLVGGQFCLKSNNEW